MCSSASLNRSQWPTTPSGASAEDEAASAATKEEAAKEASEADGAGSAVNKKTASREEDIANFRALSEAHCKQELEARVVALVREGNGVEIAASVSKTRLYANLTEHVCFYDCAAEDGSAAREHYPHHYHTTPLPHPHTTPHQGFCNGSLSLTATTWTPSWPR